MRRKLLFFIAALIVCSCLLSSIAFANETEPNQGITITGEVESYNPNSDIEACLVVGEETKYTAAVETVSSAETVIQSFEFTGVAAGTYDLMIRKTGHLSYKVVNITVSDANIDLTEHASTEVSNIKLLAGDVNADGCVDLKDVVALTSSDTYNLSFGDAICKEADINGDGCFDVRDLVIITSDNNYNKSSVSVLYDHYHIYSTSIQQPTCTTPGLTIFSCSICGDEFSIETEEALGHNEVTDPGVEPTCLKDGLSEGKHCSVCNEVFVAQEVLPKTGHTPGDWIEDIAPTYAEDGHRYIACTVCSAVIEEEILPSIFTFTLNSDGFTYTLASIGSCTDKTIVIPEIYNGLPVTIIGVGVFASNKNITSVTLPDSIIRIEDRAFRWCHSLAEINFPENVTYIGYASFSECKALTSIVIPDSVTMIGEYAFIDCSGLKSVVLSKNIKSLDNAFWGCSSLPEIELPEGLESIAYAFGHCHSLTSIKIPSTLKTIGASAFTYSGLTSIEIPETVTYIDSSAFHDCDSLETAVIGSAKIGWRAFWGCDALETVTLSSAVESMGEYAFVDCKKLGKINYNGTTEQWEKISKGNCWDENTPDYTIYCTDGTITKSGTVVCY
ncbi:MAG: hypothetical protein E7627_06375 [Ruminococcaceae bacterium]|nr:hypothetical protein [Oscillospiraceae bacterium]